MYVGMLFIMFKTIINGYTIVWSSYGGGGCY